MTPIESALWHAMGEVWDGNDLIRRGHKTNMTFDDLAEWQSAIRQTYPIHKAVCAPQVLIEPYRVDFGFYCVGDVAPIKVAIECDGHDFHERTKAQAARDRARDRAMVADGITVVRFTGSEIWRSPVGCALEISNIIAREMQRQLMLALFGTETPHAA